MKKCLQMSKKYRNFVVGICENTNKSLFIIKFYIYEKDFYISFCCADER